MDKNQGVVIQVVHTGKSGKDLLIERRIVQAGTWVRKELHLPYPRERRARITGAILYATFIVCSLVYWMWNKMLLEEGVSNVEIHEPFLGRCE
jgi:hypothetical protein